MEPKLKKKLRFGSSSKTNKKKLFLENGSIFLEKLIADCNGKSIPIRSFSSSQILKATKNFDSSCLVESLWGHGEWYKGIIKDKPYLIKKFSKDDDDEDVFNDMILSARMSNHSNFLKLLGCCFEFSSPIVLFEYAEYTCLNEKEYKVLPLSVRLKIAKEVAVVVSYLHKAFPRITIHKNINPSSIIFDKNWKAKLIDFRLSVTLPEGKSRIQDESFESSSRGLMYFDPLYFHGSLPLQTISGADAYRDPLYLYTRTLSEYIDVYSFGVWLLDVIAGRNAYDFWMDWDHANEGINVNCVEGFYEMGFYKTLQVEALGKLALRCCNVREENRPKMIKVAKELKEIERIKD